MERVEKGGMEDQVEIVARAFVDHYYHLFDNNRPSLSSLYQHTSMLSFEGQKILGVDDISKKLTQLPFDHCKHFISTIDCQPSPLAGGILVFVSGYIQLLGEEHQLRFSQVDGLLIMNCFWWPDHLICPVEDRPLPKFETLPVKIQMFQLVPMPQGSFFVQNDIFRLNYG